MIQLPPTLPLSRQTKDQAHAMERKRRYALGWLGTMWLLHPKNAPQKKGKP